MSKERTFAKPPSIGAIWAAVLSRPPVPRARELPEHIYRVRSVPIEAERAARFARAVQAPVQGPVHPGLLHVCGFPVSLALMAQPRFPAPLLGLVHVRNEFLQHRPVCAGESVDIECRVQNLRPHRRGRTFEAVTLFSRRGEILATDVSTYLSRGPANAVGPTTSRPSFVPPPPVARWKLTGATGRSYAAVSGDANPIHLSGASAKPFGFRSAIAHGMYCASRAFAEVSPEPEQPLAWEIDFGAPVPLPGTVWVNYAHEASCGETRFVGYGATYSGDEPRRYFSGAVRTLAL